MKDNKELKLFAIPHSAISSWYGYQYQGQIALYYTIHKINKFIDNNIDNEDKLINKLKNHSLELEYIEDFSIKNGDNYISLHQVKAGNSPYPLTPEVTLDILFKIINLSTEKIRLEGYFHVSDENYKISSFCRVKEKKEEIFENIEKEIKVFEKSPFKDKKQKLNTKNKKFSFVKIFKHYLKKREINISKITEYQINESISQFKIELTKYSDYFSEIILKDYYNDNLKVFDKKFPKINNISIEIKEELKTYFKKMNYKERSYCLNKAHLSLTNLLDRTIDNNKHDLKLNKISFKNIIEILQNHNLNDNEFQIYNFRFAFVRAFNQYVKEKCKKNHCEDICKKSCNLVKFIDDIKDISHENLKQFIRHIQPDSQSIVHPNNLPSDNILVDSIYELICEVGKLKLINNNKISSTKNKKNYWALAKSNLDKVERFLQRINENKDYIYMLLYEADYLIINGEHTYENINDISPNITKLNKEHFNKLGIDHSKDIYNIQKTKKIDIINKDMALEKFSEEDKS